MGGDVGTGPEDGRFELGVGFDDGMSADAGERADAGGGVDLGVGMEALLLGLRTVGGEGGLGEGGVGFEVDIAAAEVPPVALVGEDGADALFIADEVEEDGDDGLLFAGGEVLEESGADDVDAGELVSGGGGIGAEAVVDVGDFAGGGVPGDVEGVAAAAEDEGDGVAALLVVIDGGLVTGDPEVIPELLGKIFG